MLTHQGHTWRAAHMCQPFLLVAGEYTDKGYVSSENASVTALPVLIAVVVAVLGAAGYVVAATS